MAKRLRTSLVQREILFAFMQAHEDFTRNQLTGPNAEKIKNVLWKQLTQQLNSTGTGVMKTQDKWLKCWQDWKTDVKAKYSRLKTFESTKFIKDDEVHVPRPLSALEEKLLQFLDVHVVEEDLNERQKRVSFAQRELMLEIMEAHKEVALNLILGPDRTENKKFLLNELGEELNALGPAIKSPERWFKCWQDWKSDVKAKGLKIKIFNQKKANTDHDVCPPCPLSYLEKKLLKFLDVDKVELKVIEIDEAEIPKEKRVSLAQREMMFAFMHEHEDFGKNQITGPKAAKIKKVLLNKLTKQLNASGPATKSPEKWLKCWQDWKSDIKSKWHKLNNFKQTEVIMHDYARSPCPLTTLEEKVVEFLGFGKMEDMDESETWQDKKSMMKKRALTNPEQVTDFTPLLVPQRQTNTNVIEAPVPGPSSQEPGVNIEDIFQSGSSIKVELDNLDTSDSDDPLNFEEEYLVSDPASPIPEPEPEIEQPTNPARDRSRRRFRRLRRPLTQSRLDVMNHITVNEVKKALIQKNEIKKQFYAQYMVEIRKQTRALVNIAKRLSNIR